MQNIPNIATFGPKDHTCVSSIASQLRVSNRLITAMRYGLPRSASPSPVCRYVPILVASYTTAHDLTAIAGELLALVSPQTLRAILKNPSAMSTTPQAHPLSPTQSVSIRMESHPSYPCRELLSVLRQYPIPHAHPRFWMPRSHNFQRETRTAQSSGTATRRGNSSCHTTSDTTSRPV